MDFLIISKWVTDWNIKYKENPGMTAPGVINTMIAMFIGMGTKSPNSKEIDMVDNQTFVLRSLLVVAAISVPLMLLVDPCYKSRQHPNKNDSKSKVVGSEMELQNHQINLSRDYDSHSYALIS